MNESYLSGDSPRVSVVVPTFNRAGTVGRALDSVLAQTIGDLEVVVVDDGSTDGTAGAVELYLPEGVTCLRHERNRGGAAARNTGIAATSAPYVAFLDDDDEWLPEKLAVQLGVLREADPDVGIVYCGFEKVSASSGDLLERSSRAPGTSLRPVDFLRSTRFATSVALVRRECFERVGMFDEELVGTQDRDLWLRISRQYRVLGVPDVLVRHSIHAEQLTAVLGTKIRAKQQMLAKYASDLASHPEILAHDLWRLGLLCTVAGRSREARQYLWRAVRTAPGVTPALRDLALTVATPASLSQRLARGRFKHLDGIPQYY